MQLYTVRLYMYIGGRNFIFYLLFFFEGGGGGGGSTKIA